MMAALGTLSAAQQEAVATWLSAARNTEVDTVAGPDQTDGARHFNAGRLAQVRDLETDWPQRVALARKARE